ncbi:MAG: energy transducer TonB [Proteobacteria bacterium]|nr:energy transducer TonB [Pseudomonadota bacterium]
MIQRLAVTALLAGFVTFGLFYLMQALISATDEDLLEARGGRVVDFIRLKRESDLELKRRRLPDKKPPPEPPPPPELELSRAARPDLDAGGVMPVFDSSFQLAGGPQLGGAAMDMDIIPLVRLNPQYPFRAAERGIEGWVDVEFTISAAGTVVDAVVVASEPGSIFNRAALRAIRKWKYNPKIEEGVAIVRPGVRVRLVFELEDG